MSTLGRRLITIPSLFLATLLVTLTLPVWLPVAALLALLWPAASAAPRVLLFLTAYLWCETIGVIACSWLWIRRGRGRDAEERFLEGNFTLQFWWAGTLARAAARLFRLRFEIEGGDELHGDGMIVLPRHCSFGDTVLPLVFYAEPAGRRLRYVLKRELLFDPCLDIVGNRLPNYFVDRSSRDTGREVDGIQALARDLPPDQGVLLYPEGTRFSPTRRAAVIARLEQRDPQLAARARNWSRVMPPRSAGTLGLLEANPGRDVLFCAHTGFEGSAHFATLFNGSWLDTCVRIRFWRVANGRIPREPDALRRFLFDQWERMDREVESLARNGQQPPVH